MITSGYEPKAIGDIFETDITTMLIIFCICSCSQIRRRNIYRCNFDIIINATRLNIFGLTYRDADVTLFLDDHWLNRNNSTFVKKMAATAVSTIFTLRKVSTHSFIRHDCWLFFSFYLILKRKDCLNMEETIHYQKNYDSTFFTTLLQGHTATQYCTVQHSRRQMQRRGAGGGVRTVYCRRYLCRVLRCTTS
jgi:hypothetical protein